MTVDQLEYMTLVIWFSENIGTVWVRVRADELDFQYHIDPIEPPDASLDWVNKNSTFPSGSPTKVPLFIALPQVISQPHPKHL